MTRITLILAIAMLCGCGGRRVQRIAGSDPTPPLPHVVPDVAPVQPERESLPPVSPAPFDPAPPAEKFEASVEPPHVSADAAMHLLNSQMEDVFFAYDHFDLSAEALGALRHDAELLHSILHDFPMLQISVEGHCDERGSAEYNLGLGDRRAARAEEFLYQLGLPRANFARVSYGKEKPQCTEATESCWQLNRRAHFVVRTAPTE